MSEITCKVLTDKQQKALVVFMNTLTVQATAGSQQHRDLLDGILELMDDVCLHAYRIAVKLNVPKTPKGKVTVEYIFDKTAEFPIHLGAVKCDLNDSKEDIMKKVEEVINKIKGSK